MDASDLIKQVSARDYSQFMTPIAGPSATGDGSPSGRKNAPQCLRLRVGIGAMLWV